MIREKISLSIHEMTVVAMMVAMIAILGAVPGIPLGFIPVPIVLQNMGIMIAGELLEPKLGTIAVWLFLFLVVLGLPLLSGGRGGMVTILGPTSGYIFAWLFVPLLIGLSLKLSWYYGMTQGVTELIAALTSNILFVFGDTIKALIAVSITRRLRHIKISSLRR
ncbi:biotin transporter BioY [Limosilactobacillus reuteri]|uniref:Biotin transporter n=1 Tax=Limosilactobacillus reuteri TaxID=1598 RepID=A0A0U5JJZ0_LIMRT|nr:Substrate-specific component BioY of biotin ECF transporter [Limosilactobacillus reuteri subsp. porcinus]